MSAHKFLTTGEMAGLMRVASSTVHKRCNLFGDFWGVLPVKAPNGRLLWPADDVHALLKQHKVEENT